MFYSIDPAKRLAKIIAKQVRLVKPMQLSQAQQLTSKILGYVDWHALARDIGLKQPRVTAAQAQEELRSALAQVGALEAFSAIVKDGFPTGDLKSAQTPQLAEDDLFIPHRFHEQLRTAIGACPLGKWVAVHGASGAGVTVSSFRFAARDPNEGAEAAPREFPDLNGIRHEAWITPTPRSELGTLARRLTGKNLFNLSAAEAEKRAARAIVARDVKLIVVNDAHRYLRAGPARRPAIFEAFDRLSAATGVRFLFSGHSDHGEGSFVDALHSISVAAERLTAAVQFGGFEVADPVLTALVDHAERSLPVSYRGYFCAPEARSKLLSMAGGPRPLLLGWVDALFGSLALEITLREKGTTLHGSSVREGDPTWAQIRRASSARQEPVQRLTDTFMGEFAEIHFQQGMQTDVPPSSNPFTGTDWSDRILAIASAEESQRRVRVKPKPPLRVVTGTCPSVAVRQILTGMVADTQECAEGSRLHVEAQGFPFLVRFYHETRPTGGHFKVQIESWARVAARYVDGAFIMGQGSRAANIAFEIDDNVVDVPSESAHWETLPDIKIVEIVDRLSKSRPRSTTPQQDRELNAIARYAALATGAISVGMVYESPANRARFSVGPFYTDMDALSSITTEIVARYAPKGWRISGGQSRPEVRGYSNLDQTRLSQDELARRIDGKAYITPTIRDALLRLAAWTPEADQLKHVATNVYEFPSSRS